jgi:tRNA (cytidine32/guanosine34-2'-O)-methyltransferase
MESAEHPPDQVQGVSDEFIEQLERVDRKKLKPDMTCPICSNPFLEGA